MIKKVVWQHVGVFCTTYQGPDSPDGTGEIHIIVRGLKEMWDELLVIPHSALVEITITYEREEGDAAVC